MTDDTGRTTTREPSLPIPKKPFLPNDELTIRRLGQTEPEVPTVYLFADVAEELIYTAQYRSAQTTAGLLSGGYYQGPAGEFIEIRGFRDSSVVDNALEFGRQLQVDWLTAQYDPDLYEAGQIIIGWFFSRPGSGATPGPFEMIVQHSFFNRPYHLLLMMDPLERLLGLYIREGEVGSRNIGFNLIEPPGR